VRTPNPQVARVNSRHSITGAPPPARVSGARGAGSQRRWQVVARIPCDPAVPRPAIPPCYPTLRPAGRGEGEGKGGRCVGEDMHWRGNDGERKGEHCREERGGGRAMQGMETRGSLCAHAFSASFSRCARAVERATLCPLHTRSRVLHE